MRMTIPLLFCEWEEKLTRPTQSLPSFKCSVSGNPVSWRSAMSDFFIMWPIPWTFQVVSLSDPDIGIVKLERK